MLSVNQTNSVIRASMHRNSRPRLPLVLSILLLLFSNCYVSAHEHHQSTPADPKAPVATVLWIHIAVQAFVWTILFPLTMVLGMIRHRMHVPLAVLSLAITTLGFFLGHSNPGTKTGYRGFPHSAHGTLASILVIYLAAQAVLGSYLRLHLKEKRLRPAVLFLHGLLGKTFPVIGFVQMLFGITTLQSWCYGGHLGQCLAHHIMGGAFSAYSIILLIMMKAGGAWLKRRRCSQEFFDSWVIFLWGLVNAFTEHHGGPWTHKDLQHTMLGVVWVGGGAVGIWTSRKGRRSVFPGVMLILTGWAMSGHAQALMLSTMVHALFGYTLMAAGLARIIEICFVMKDEPSGTSSTGDFRDDSSTPGETQWFDIKSWQYLPPYLLVASGFLFMSATDEELRWADSKGVDHITWGLIDFSISLAIFFWSNVLIDLYISWGGKNGAAKYYQSQNGSGGAMERGNSVRGLYSRLSTGGNPTAAATNSNPISHEMSQVTSNGTIPNGNGNGTSNHFKSDDSDEQEEDARHVLFDEDEDEEDARDLHPFNRDSLRR